MPEATPMGTHPVDNESLELLFHRAARLMIHGGHHNGPGQHAQGRILTLLNEKGALTQRELMNILGVRSGSLSEVLGKLETNGYILRTRDEQDKRGFVVNITNTGYDMVKNHEKWRKEKSNALFSPLSDAERTQLVDILIKLTTVWENDYYDNNPRVNHHLGRGKFRPHKFPMEQADQGIAQGVASRGGRRRMGGR